MLTRTGDLIKEAQTGVILHQANAQGVMGAGFALQLHRRWPQVLTDYRNQVSRGRPDLGRGVMGRLIMTQVDPELWVATVVGQQFVGRSGRLTSYDALDVGLSSLADWLVDHQQLCDHVHHPLIGCGLGGGAWPVVKALIEQHLGATTSLWTLPGT